MSVENLSGYLPFKILPSPTTRRSNIGAYPHSSGTSRIVSEHRLKLSTDAPSDEIPAPLVLYRIRAGFLLIQGTTFRTQRYAGQF
jgi:hypothetical protein